VLWTITGLLSGVVLHLMLLAQFVNRSGTIRVGWMAGLCVLWCMNAFFGAIVFYLVAMGIVTEFMIWKPLLATSTFVFTGLLGAVLYINRKASKSEFDGSWWILLYGLFTCTGYMAIGSLWIH